MTPYEFLMTHRPHTLHIQRLDDAILAMLFRHRARRVVLAMGRGATVEDALREVIPDYRRDGITDALIRAMDDRNMVQVSLSMAPGVRCRITVSYAMPRVALTRYTYAPGAQSIQRLLDGMLSERRDTR